MIILLQNVQEVCPLIKFIAFKGQLIATTYFKLIIVKRI